MACSVSGVAPVRALTGRSDNAGTVSSDVSAELSKSVESMPFLLLWIAPGSGRGFVQLDLVNCTRVESELILGNLRATRAGDDIGSVTAREQERREGMNYGDLVDRLVRLVGMQDWVNRIWYVLYATLFSCFVLTIL